MSFMPQSYETLGTNKNYWRLPQMNEGDNRLRIVTRPIAGWIDWKDNKPLRFLPENKPKASINPDKPMKPFWACIVWDYSRDDLFILEITQTGVIKQLVAYGEDDDWGDFTKYDLKIKKEGSGKDSRYTITPLPHRPLLDIIQDVMDRVPIRLEALYEGRDPWKDLTPGAPVMGKDASIGEEDVANISSEEAKAIRDMIGEDSVYMNKILGYYQATSFEEIPNSCLDIIINKVKTYNAKKVDKVAKKVEGVTAPWEVAHA